MSRVEPAVPIEEDGILIILIAMACVAVGVLAFAERTRRRGWTTVALLRGLVGTVLLAYGLLGFSGAFLSATGRLASRSENSEFPMRYVNDAVVDADGLIYCPSTPWGRIQVYDRDKRFLRGWFVNAYGGTFRLHIDADQHLQVATARGRMLYVYDRDGHLLSSASYDPRSYSDFDNLAVTAVVIPTPLYLLPLTHPLFAWATALVGLVLLVAPGRRGPGQADAWTVSDVAPGTPRKDEES